jgi:hypothetical protein
MSISLRILSPPDRPGGGAGDGDSGGLLMDFPLTCPRCGSREICTAGRGEHQTEYGLHCSSCGHEGWGKTISEAIDQWEAVEE